MTESVIGKPVDGVDVVCKVTGAATYVAEVVVPGVAHAAIVGSTIARGRIAEIDARAARAVPGVLAVITHLEAPRLPGVNATMATTRILQVLQDPEIYYNDQPVAVVVAETLEAAQHAAGLVITRYDQEPAVARMPHDLDAGYEPANAGPRGEPRSNRGNVEIGLRAASVTIDATYVTPVVSHSPMEPHATIAVWEGDTRVTLYDSTQSIFAVRDRIAIAFGLDKRDVRVINHFVGRGFGCKGASWSHVLLSTMAAKLLCRPVKLVLTRPQMFALVGHRPETMQRVTLGADAEGRLTAIRHDVLSETSYGGEFVESSAMQTRMLYACANVSTSHRLIRIDVPTPTFARAPGEASGSFALESAMDELAVELAIDPLELRLRNHANVDPESATPWSSKSLRECYRAGAERFGWHRRAPAPRMMRDGRMLVGWGMATATYPARQLSSSATVRIGPDGIALVQAGTQDLGATSTIMTQIAAEHLDVPIHRVQFVLGDPVLPEAFSGRDDRGTGAAVALACRALRTKLVEQAIRDPLSPLHGAPAAKVVSDDGMLVYGTQRDPYSAIVARSGHVEISADFRARPSTSLTAEHDRESIHAFGADFAEVRVDEELGEIRVTRFVGAFGCGTIVNPKTARSQLVGGIVSSIGMALHEHTERDPRTARTVTRDLVEYHIPTHADVPDIDIITIDETDARANVVGAKGVGEIGNTGAAAAIANAVFHATGVRVRELPITPEKVFGGGS